MWKGFQKPKRLAAELESLTEKYGRFSAQPFERGWGTTVGNALRRALLSSIEGAAITAVKIEGVLHEFSSIPGVVEDATDIILNLKQVPIKLNNDLPKTIYLNVEQPGVGHLRADRGRRGFRRPRQERLHRHRQRRRQTCRSKCASRTAAAMWPPTATTTKTCPSATSRWIQRPLAGAQGELLGRSRSPWAR